MKDRLFHEIDKTCLMRVKVRCLHISIIDFCLVWHHIEIFHVLIKSWHEISVSICSGRHVVLVKPYSLKCLEPIKICWIVNHRVWKIFIIWSKVIKAQ